ncbi:MAG: Polyketide cyclase / dehydrase and lipid transport [Actinomycetota bacterium]|nr:Polyketide cyclase / dehydrase and lipid transport [Actinomycetota bacterium]
MRGKEERMPHAENETVVERPPGEVFAFLADPQNDPQWRSGVLDIQRVSGRGRRALPARSERPGRSPHRCRHRNHRVPTRRADRLQGDQRPGPPYWTLRTDTGSERHPRPIQLEYRAEGGEALDAAHGAEDHAERSGSAREPQARPREGAIASTSLHRLVLSNST